MLNKVIKLVELLEHCETAEELATIRRVIDRELNKYMNEVNFNGVRD